MIPSQGATATAVFVWTEEGKRYLQAANVGDSAAFLRYHFFSRAGARAGGFLDYSPQLTAQTDAAIKRSSSRMTTRSRTRERGRGWSVWV